MIQQKEARSRSSGARASRSLETYLREHGPTPETAEVVFQLAELKWEEAKSQFLTQMARVQCRRREVQAKRKQPKLPARRRRAGARSDVVAGALPAALKDYPQFRKTDAVLYLYGFSLRSEGKVNQALVQFKRILNEHPRSRFRPDAWMAVAEARFYDDNDYKGALAGYDEVLQVSRFAALRSGAVQDRLVLLEARRHRSRGAPLQGGARPRLGVTPSAGARHQLTEAGRKRLEELKGEALEYLVQVFTEDERKGPKDAFDFLASIGGAILAQGHRASSPTPSTRRRATSAPSSPSASSSSSIQTTRATPIGRSASSRRCARWTRTRRPSGAAQARRELQQPAATGPRRSRIRKRSSTRTSCRPTCCAKSPRALHADAQHNEQQQKGHIDVDRYARAADAYAYYLTHSAPTPTRRRCIISSAISISSSSRNTRNRAITIWRSASRSRGQAASRGALASDRAVRKAAQGPFAGGRKELLPTDKRMGEAIDLSPPCSRPIPKIANIL